MATTRYRNGEQRIVAVIGDEDMVTGFLLAGVGDDKALAQHGGSAAGSNGTTTRNPADCALPQAANYFVVTNTTPLSDIELAFTSLTGRRDVGIVVIAQNIANDIRPLLRQHTAAIPCVLEVPSRGQQYDAERDYVMAKITRSLGVR